MLKYLSYDIVFQEIPDEVTLAINLSNCPNRCKECHSPHLQQDVGEWFTEDVLVELLNRYASAITCVCFMGGDAAPQEVRRLACCVRARSCLKTAWYSGRNLRPVPTEVQPFDYLKLGAYVAELGGLRSAATNQRLYKVAAFDQSLEDITCRFWNL